MCRWPVGDPTPAEFRFCGAKKSATGTGPYCPYHSRIAYQPVQERRRERTRAAGAKIGLRPARALAGRSFGLAERLVEGIAGAAHGADRIALAGRATKPCAGARHERRRCVRRFPPKAPIRCRAVARARTRGRVSPSDIRAGGIRSGRDGRRARRARTRRVLPVELEIAGDEQSGDAIRAERAATGPARAP